MTVRSRVTYLGAVAGVLSAAAGIGIASLIAGFTGSVGSPMVAVGGAAIDLTPPPVKNFAISTFGSHDKVVLLSGIAVVLAIYAAFVGIAALRDLRLGLAGVGIFALIGLAAAVSRPTFAAQDVLPTLVGAAAAAFALTRFAAAAVPGRAAAQAIAAAGRGPAGKAQPSRPDPGPAKPGQPKAARATLQVTERPRRDFLALGAAAAGTAAVSGVAGRLLSERANVTAAVKALRLPRAVRPAPPLPAGTDLRIPGLASFITPNSQFYRVDTALVLPQVAPASWRLRVHGMVRKELTLTFDQLLRRPLIEDYITLTCVSDPVEGPYISNAKWLGASLGAVLREAGIKAGADQLFCTSADGFTSGTPVQTAMDGRDALLAVGMNGQPLPVAHGFPVRTVVPGLYGYVSACKWITDIQVTTYASNYPYWAQRGWAQRAPIKTESRIDVPSGHGPLAKGPTKIAGIAWAQHRGIDAVEVRVDRGPWQHATLAAVPGIDTWRQWVLDWDATPGSHVIEARATDASGYTQTPQQLPPEPNGATGYPIVQVSVSS